MIIPKLDDLIEELKTDKDLASNKEYVLDKSNNHLPKESLLELYTPKRDWFIMPTTNIHGIMHETRVLIYAEILGQIEYAGGNKVDIDALRYAAITHDVRRISDWPDFPHGKRAAEWILATKPIPEQKCSDVAEIVKWHVTQDNAIPNMTPELRIFKDADGLDRWRIGDLNTNYLRTWHACNMTTIAKYLFLVSTSLRKEKNNSDFDSVIEAGKILEIIR